MVPRRGPGNLQNDFFDFKDLVEHPSKSLYHRFVASVEHRCRREMVKLYETAYKAFVGKFFNSGCAARLVFATL
jgi:hypothetical protein